MAKTQDRLRRVAMCRSSHRGSFYTTAALPSPPGGSRMLKGCHGLASMIQAGMVLAFPMKQVGPRGLECLPPGSVEGLVGSPHVRLTGPTKRTYARPLADHALDQALPAVPRRCAARGRGCGARRGPPALLPSARGYARAAAGHRPPRLPTPACRLPSGQPPAAPRRGPPRLTS